MKNQSGIQREWVKLAWTWILGNFWAWFVWKACVKAGFRVPLWATYTANACSEPRGRYFTEEADMCQANKQLLTKQLVVFSFMWRVCRGKRENCVSPFESGYVIFITLITIVRPGKTGGAGGPWPPHFFAKQSCMWN